MSTADAGESDFIAWFRERVWEGLEFSPALLGVIIFVLSYIHDYSGDSHQRIAVVFIAHWVIGVGLIAGNIIWIKRLKDKPIRDYIKQFDWTGYPNPDYIDEKGSWWFKWRCSRTDALFMKAYSAAPTSSERHKRISKYHEEYQSVFIPKKYNTKSSGQVQAPVLRDKKWHDQYTKFMETHPVFEGVAWLISGALMTLVFGFTTFVLLFPPPIWFGAFLCGVLTIAAVLLSIAGIAHLAQRSSRIEAFRFDLKRFPALRPDLRRFLNFGRTSPRSAALIDASRCWGVIILAWLLAERFVPVWSFEAFPTDQRAYVWYAAFAVIGVAMGASFYLGRNAKGPADYRMLGRAVLQFGIGVAVIFGSPWAAYYSSHWVEDIGGLIGIWLCVVASAKIIMLPWLPSMRQIFRRR